MATPDHTPLGRGYDSALSYFHHLNDYWDEQFYDTAASTGLAECDGFAGYDKWRPVDLWLASGGTEGPAHGLNNSLEQCSIATKEYCFPSDDSIATAAKECPAYPGHGDQPGTSTKAAAAEGCEYEDGLFESTVLRRISEHDPATPLFLMWALHIVHAPLQVPRRFLEAYASVATDDWRRQRYLAMVSYMDAAVANVTGALKARGMWQDTLLVLTSDNGGAVYRNGSAGANNYPLRGGKASHFEGGVRVNAFVAGGWLPPPMHGRKLSGLGAVWDWYGTFAALGGVDPTDARAAAAGLPPIDSVNLWPYISCQAASSGRSQLGLGSSSCVKTWAECINEWGLAPSTTVVNGLLADFGAPGAPPVPEAAGRLWKVLVGLIPMDG
jgi:arylsulfatase B